MILDMYKLKKEYLRKILAISLNNRNYSTVVFHASFCLDEVKGIIEELKDEFHLDHVIFIDFDYDKIKSFYESNPTEEQQKEFIPKCPIPTGNMKIIYFDSLNDLSKKYFSEVSGKYYRRLRNYNKELFDRIDSSVAEDMIVTICPHKEWAESLLGSQEELQDLWLKINNILFPSDDEEKEMKKRIERMRKLNHLNIRNLYFYTDLGTDFRIRLNTHSIWRCEPNNVNGVFSFINYPSYEIYTSPDCYSAEGKIVLSKKERFYDDTVIETAIFEFLKGKLISCESNNKKFVSTVFNKLNKMDRIGEIALVSSFSPLAKSGEFYDSLLLDENTGCHFALGNYLEYCVGIKKEKLEKKGARYYHYNPSEYHTDLVFGDDTISVEAELKGKKKVLLMEKGKWVI